MPPLKDPQHEKYAQIMAKGKVSQEEAYVQAGFKRDSGNAARLRANKTVNDRIVELQKVSAKKVGITIEWLQKEWLGLLDLAKSDADKQTITKALENLSKHAGFYETDNNQRTNINFQIVDYSKVDE